MAGKRIEIYDTTLRDGSQSEGISFSVLDKCLIAECLDHFGVPYIEGGWPGANPKDVSFFEEIRKKKLKNAVIVAFGSTRRAHEKAEHDAVLAALVAARTRVITIFGKTWDLHVTEALKTTLDENLFMIRDSVRYLKSKTGKVFYDAEHFFDGYKANAKYALKTLEAAADAGASTLILCDTNGGTLPATVSKVVTEVRRLIGKPLGIHTHNDGGVAAANALAAVEAGATQVQGTFNGIGERCGNADLVALIGDLQLKLGYRCVPVTRLKELTETAHSISEICNLLPAKNQPYVGASAFAHKGGVHINAVIKNPKTYEHIRAEQVGNRRRFLVSELGGKTQIAQRAKELSLSLEKHSPETRLIHQKVQEMESQGYQYEGAEASFELLVQEVLGRRKKFFSFKKVHVSAENIGEENPIARATVLLAVGKKEETGTATGDGPVNALDRALRKALAPFYPEINRIELADYKVRVVNSEAGTAAKVRVFIEFRDDKKIWTTVGVSENIIDASWLALVDAIEYKLSSSARPRKRR